MKSHEAQTKANILSLGLLYAKIRKETVGKRSASSSVYSNGAAAKSFIMSLFH
jgi:hypothetical protein